MLPWKMSCVLITRVMIPVALMASVCARIMASASRIRTRDGGTTTPRVLATQTIARLRAGATPRCRSRGCTMRDSVATLAPTEPFIGARMAPSPIADSSGADAVRASIAVPVRNRMSASGRRLSSAPMKT